MDLTNREVSGSGYLKENVWNMSFIYEKLQWSCSQRKKYAKCEYDQ